VVVEGNTRRAYAIDKNIAFVPVKVVHSSNINGGLLIPNKKNVKSGSVCASTLGFKVFKKFPYLHKKKEKGETKRMK
jgi:hypothetical protein